MASKIELINNTLSTGQIVVELLTIIIKSLFAIATAIFYCFTEKPQKSVKNDIVLVTGAGHGIGRALAKKYASEGATVVCWDINKENNEETVREIAKLGMPKAYAYVCDVANSVQVEETAKIVEREVGCVTILINNAGIGFVNHILNASTTEIENTLKVNTISHFWTIKAFLPGMKRLNRGHIVTICSIAGLYGARYATAYCASKFAVRGLIEALFQDLRLDAKNKIEVTLIYPSGVTTGIFKKASIRFPKLLPLISAEEAAEHIIKAQRQNLFECSIPPIALIANHLSMLLPRNARDVLFDFFDTYVIE